MKEKGVKTKYLGTIISIFFLLLYGCQNQQPNTPEQIDQKNENPDPATIEQESDNWATDNLKTITTPVENLTFSIPKNYKLDIDEGPFFATDITKTKKIEIPEMLLEYDIGPLPYSGYTRIVIYENPMGASLNKWFKDQNLYIQEGCTKTEKGTFKNVDKIEYINACGITADLSVYFQTNKKNHIFQFFISGNHLRLTNGDAVPDEIDPDSTEEFYKLLETVTF